MRITTKRRYAVTAMLDVALHQSNGAVSLKDIADRQKIPLQYLEQLFAKLRKQELLTSIRGPGGGYLITKDLNKITVAQVINAVEELELTQNHCSGICSCKETSVPCLTHKLWNGLNQVVLEYLNSVTFANLANDKITLPENFCHQIKNRTNK